MMLTIAISCVSDYVSGCLVACIKVKEYTRGEREIRPRWSAIYAILMSMSPSELATGSVAQLILRSRIHDSSHE
jgi:hypothetical protein